MRITWKLANCGWTKKNEVGRFLWKARVIISTLLSLIVEIFLALTSIQLCLSSWSTHATDVAWLVFDIVTQWMHPDLTISKLYPVNWILFSARWVFLKRQKAQISGSISCNSWAVVSERIAFFLTGLAFRFVEKKRCCFSAFLLGGKDLVFKYWWSLPITERPFATAVAERIWRNAVLKVSLLGAVWITSVSSAMAASALLFRSSSSLSFWSSLSAWMKFPSSSRLSSISLLAMSLTLRPRALQYWQHGYVHRQPLL